MTRKQINAINRVFKLRAEQYKKRLFNGKYSMQQAVKFELVDEQGFLTFDGLDDCRKFENV